MSVKQRCRRLSIGYAIPLLVLYVVMPAFLKYFSKSLSHEECKVACSMMLQRFLPVTALIWPVMFSAEAMASRGNELLYVRRRIKAGYYILSVVLYMMLAFPVYKMAEDMCHLDNYGWEYLRLFVSVGFLVGIYYMISYMSGNYLLANVVCIAYVVFSTFTNESGEFWRLYDSRLASKAVIEEQYILFVVAGIAAWIEGIRCNDEYERYM